MLIDPPSWPAHGRMWSHLISDTSYGELHRVAREVGLSPRLFDLDHYDVPQDRYPRAVAAGALEVSGHELIHRLIDSGLRVPGRDR